MTYVLVGAWLYLLVGYWTLLGLVDEARRVRYRPPNVVEAVSLILFWPLMRVIWWLARVK